MLAGAGAGLGDRGRETDGAVMRDDDTVDAGALGRAQQNSEVLRVLQRIDDKNERGLGKGVEMKEELVERHARLALNDRDDTLMVLDRREPGGLRFVGVPDAAAALL